MPRKIILTNDGSHSIQWKEGVTFHSIHGAIQESLHIYIRAGLEPLLGRTESRQDGPLRIFEMGLGTGLNALLTYLQSSHSSCPIHYEAVEAFPLEEAITGTLNYCDHVELSGSDCGSVFAAIHRSAWGVPIALRSGFQFVRSIAQWPAYTLREPADLVYYDAFDPVTQPECWTLPVFVKLYSQLVPGAVLVTYCCKGIVRKALQTAGFLVEKLPGPPGKREILRARKPIAQS